MNWMKFFEEIVNLPTGPDLTIEEKLSKLKNVESFIRSLEFECKYGKGSLIAEMGNPPYITLALGKGQKFISKEEFSFFLAGLPGMLTVSSRNSNIFLGLLSKNCSAAVVPSVRSIKKI